MTNNKAKVFSNFSMIASGTGNNKSLGGTFIPGNAKLRCYTTNYTAMVLPKPTKKLKLNNSLRYKSFYTIKIN